MKSRKVFAEEERNKALMDGLHALAKRKACTAIVLSLAWLLKEGCVPNMGLVSKKGIGNALDTPNVERQL